MSDPKNYRDNEYFSELIYNTIEMSEKYNPVELNYKYSLEWLIQLYYNILIFKNLIKILNIDWNYYIFSKKIKI